MKRSLNTVFGFVAFAAAGPVVAATTCDATNLFSFNFNSVATTQLAYGNSYSYTATNGASVSRNFSVNITQNGLASTAAGGATMPRIDTNPLQTSSGGRELTLGGIFSARTPAITGTTRVILVTFSFTTPVRELSLSVHDIDYSANQYRDWFLVTASDGSNTFSDPALSLSTSPSVRVGPGGNPNLAANEAIGTGTSANNADTGNIDILFNEPVTSVTIRYGNYPLGTGETITGQQAMGISKLSFCPLPNVSVTKTSAPLDTTGTTRFAIPGSDVVYTLTVTNSGGSTVDLNSLVLTDVLPSTVSFYNGDFSSSSPGMGPFELTAGSSNVTLPSSAQAYSNNGGATYAYSPSSGYDSNVTAVRLTPTGNMAANSSFTIRFRAKVK